MAAEINATIRDLKNAEWQFLPHSIQSANLGPYERKKDLGEQQPININLIVR